MKEFIVDLGVVASIEEPIPLLCDNNGAIAQAKDPRVGPKSRHVLRRFHLIREIIERKDIQVERVPSADNVADPLTKPMTKEVLDEHKRAMGLKCRIDWL